MTVVSEEERATELNRRTHENKKMMVKSQGDALPLSGQTTYSGATLALTTTTIIPELSLSNLLANTVVFFDEPTLTLIPRGREVALLVSR